MNGIIGFIFGLFLGGWIGLFVACLMMTGGKDER